MRYSSIYTNYCKTKKTLIHIHSLLLLLLLLGSNYVFKARNGEKRPFNDATILGQRLGAQFFVDCGCRGGALFRTALKDVMEIGENDPALVLIGKGEVGACRKLLHG